MDKISLIIQLIGTQDAKAWNESALLEWATKMAELIIGKHG